MSIHSTLTGTDLHESKGAAAATANTVAVADGLGSAQWKPIPAAALATNTFFNLNTVWLQSAPFTWTTSATLTYLFYIPIACTISSMTIVFANATTTVGTMVMDLFNNGVGSMGRFTVAGNSTAGEVITLPVTTNNNVVAGNTLYTAISGSGTPYVTSLNVTCNLT